MLQKLQIKDIFVGKIDAKNELIENTKEEKDRFIDSFLIPENIDIKEYIDGKRYYITGLKGTGKTALLRYIALAVEEEIKATISFILFKSDFTDEDKTAFSKAANTFIAINNNENYDDEDFLNVWQWFLHRQIVHCSKNPNDPFFINNNEWKRYKECITAPKLENEKSGIMHILPKLKRGNVEIGGDINYLRGNLGLEFEWDNEKSKQVKFSSIVRQANELFKKLTPANKRLYIFLDELEISLGKIKQYKKDIHLIRDLIIAVSIMNQLSRKMCFPLFFIAAIRSEVITAVQSSGKEINKTILDFGKPVKWQQSGGNASTHPLVKIINKKIQATESFLSFQDKSSDAEIWTKYFPEKIDIYYAPEYILRRTWYRPRDIVRILTIAQQQCPNETIFSQQVFDSISKEYSTQSWIELEEELKTTYTESEVNGIKRLLTSIKCPFAYGEIVQAGEKKREYYNELDNLLNKYKMGDILSVLYRVGIIGNTGERVRYSFRGDDELVIEGRMKIHDPLWNYFSIEHRRD
jgi:energy-coupling factor transporter ATP-binding protein EcfA2